MNRDRQLRGFLIAMVVGAGLVALGQLATWPPKIDLERGLIGVTVAVTLLAALLTVYQWRQDRRRHGQVKRP